MWTKSNPFRQNCVTRLSPGASTRISSLARYDLHSVFMKIKAYIPHELRALATMMFLHCDILSLFLGKQLCVCEPYPQDMDSFHQHNPHSGEFSLPNTSQKEVHFSDMEVPDLACSHMIQLLHWLW